MSCAAYHRDPAVWVGEAEGTAKVCQRPMFKFMIIKPKMNKCLLKSLYTLGNLLQHYPYKLLANENTACKSLWDKRLSTMNNYLKAFPFFFSIMISN